MCGWWWLGWWCCCGIIPFDVVCNGTNNIWLAVVDAWTLILVGFTTCWLRLQRHCVVVFSQFACVVVVDVESRSALLVSVVVVKRCALAVVV